VAPTLAWWQRAVTASSARFFGPQAAATAPLQRIASLAVRIDQPAQLRALLVTKGRNV
jgi:hypothetical protein